MKVLIIVGIAIIVIIAMFIWAYYEEKKAFNNGTCPYCGHPLKFVTKDSQGGKMYQCPRCRYTVWISYFK